MYKPYLSSVKISESSSLSIQFYGGQSSVLSILYLPLKASDIFRLIFYCMCYFWVENLSNLCKLTVFGSQTLGSTQQTQRFPNNKKQSHRPTQSCIYNYCLTKISIQAKRSIYRVFSLFIVPSPFFVHCPYKGRINRVESVLTGLKPY